MRKMYDTPAQERLAGGYVALLQKALVLRKLYKVGNGIHQAIRYEKGHNYVY